MFLAPCKPQMRSLQPVYDSADCRQTAAGPTETPAARVQRNKAVSYGFLQEANQNLKLRAPLALVALPPRHVLGSF